MSHVRACACFRFSDANGGEYRKSFHALAPPFAALIESPQVIGGAPMQIDTWNRDKMRLPTPENPLPPPFVPGPVPTMSVAPTEGPDAIYSGLLECPRTTRVARLFNPGSADFNDTYAVEVAATACGHAVASPADCFAAVQGLPGLQPPTQVATQTVDSALLPAGCSVSVAAGGNATATFNTHSTAGYVAPTRALRTSCVRGWGGAQHALSLCMGRARTQKKMGRGRVGR
jgi:hypothetical protein